MLVRPGDGPERQGGLAGDQGRVAALCEGASIIDIASQAGGGATIYAASEGAMMSWTRGLAEELDPQGVRVNAPTPGLIGARFHDDSAKPEGRAPIAGDTALRRDGGAFVAGLNLDVNGGPAL